MQKKKKGDVLSNLSQYTKILKNWKKEDLNKIINVLNAIMLFESTKPKSIEQVQKVICSFHRQIHKIDNVLKYAEWFSLCIKIKLKLKQMKEYAQKLIKITPPYQKKPLQQINCPVQLTQGYGNYENSYNLKLLYKGFVGCFSQAANNAITISFIRDTYKEIKRIYPQTKTNSDEGIRKRCISICNRLNRQSSVYCKIKMLNRQISPSQLANDDLEIYEDQKMTSIKIRFQTQMMEASCSNFYKDMKKNVNKDACEDCIFCKNKTAYCQDMKQIRSADEPMTRFMRCNTCDKGWKD